MNINAKHPIMVAHRGYPERYPENSLIGIKAALDAGAKAIEFDIQLSRDLYPVLYHDDTLARVSNHEGHVYDYSWDELATISTAETSRFDNTFQEIKVSRLLDLVELLQHYPAAEVFVEIKRESLQQFGDKVVVESVLNTVQPIIKQCVITSYELPALEFSRHLGHHPVAWVLREYSNESLDAAQQLQPAFLLCNIKKLPDTEDALWQGDWRWMLYETQDPELAIKWFKRGAEYIETNAIGDVLQKLSKL